MDSREKKLLDAMFKKLEKATNGFVREGGVLLGTRHFSSWKEQKPARQKAPKWFSGFTSSPEEYIQTKIKARYPEATRLVLFLEDCLWYGFYGKAELSGEFLEC